MSWHQIQLYHIHSSWVRGLLPASDNLHLDFWLKCQWNHLYSLTYALLQAYKTTVWKMFKELPKYILATFKTRETPCRSWIEGKSLMMSRCWCYRTHRNLSVLARFLRVEPKLRNCRLLHILRRWEYQTILPVCWETCVRVKKQQLEPCMEQLTGSRLRKEYDRAVCCHPVCLICLLSTSWTKCWAGWVTSCNQHRWEKHKQPQTHGWHHLNGRKQRRTKEPLDEGEGREWKSWLKTKY